MSMTAFRDLKKTGEPSVIEADNSLSRALFVLHSAVTTAGASAGAATAASYAAVVTLERTGIMQARRRMRWAAPLGIGMVAAFIGTRVGLYAGIDTLNAKATLERQAGKYAEMQAELDAKSDMASRQASSRTRSPFQKQYDETRAARIAEGGS